MARLTPQTPARHLLLQVALLVILIGTLALAGAVSRYKVRSHQVKLAAPIKVHDFQVRLPADWSVDLSQHRHVSVPGPTILRVVEANASDRIPGRVLTIVRDRIGMPQPPLEYLLTHGLMSQAYVAALGGSAKFSNLPPIQLANHTAHVAAGIRAVRHPSGQLVAQREVFATAMLPSRDVLTVVVTGIGSQDIKDELELVKQVAASIDLPSPPLVSSEAVTLAHDCIVKVPAGFLPLPEPDPQITERHLLRAAPPNRWSAVTLVPCVFFPDDSHESFRTMLTARDGEWLDAVITSLPPTTRPATTRPVAPTPPNLRADLPMRAGLPFPRRVYLLTSPSGNALLVEMHAGSAMDAAEWDALIQQIASSATPSTGPQPVALLSAGGAEIQRLRKIGLPTLLADAPQDQFWLWTDRNRPIGWTRTAFSPGEPSKASFESRALFANGAASMTRHTCETSADFSRHEDATVWSDIHPNETNPVERLQERTSVAGGAYALAIRRDAATGQGGQTTGRVPKAFLPGPWLPLLLPHLPSKEMILRIGRMPGIEAHSPSAAVTVRLKPTTRPGTFAADVSGTGQYFILAPDRLDLSATMSRSPVTPEKIAETFRGVPALAPE